MNESKRVDELLPNSELQAGKTREERLVWATEKCPHCGDRMFFLFDDGIGDPVCRSNLYMDGGC